MNTTATILGLRTAGTVFAIVCIAQALRVITRVDVTIAGYELPIWANLIACLITGILSAWMWILSLTPRLAPKS